MIDIRTHDKIDTSLCGVPVETGPGSATVQMSASDLMAVDARGLVHGGFLFSLADHAAMIAVNHPNVVLAGAEVKFLKPVAAGDLLIARASVAGETGRRRTVNVTVLRDKETVFEGTFTCAILEKHVLEIP
jgi:uncharacterized protein (TIGR00369 family)